MSVTVIALVSPSTLCTKASGLCLIYDSFVRHLLSSPPNFPYVGGSAFPFAELFQNLVVENGLADHDVPPRCYEEFPRS